MRPSKDEMFMAMARSAAERSTCSSRAKVGAIAVQDELIISMGWNGVPRGIEHCDESECKRGKDGKHLYLIHAEENVIANAARLGVSLKGATVYVTHSPCSHCAGLLIQVGISRLVVGKIFGDTWLVALKILQRAEISMEVG